MKKKLFTFALCIIMVAAIAVPAFAAEPPQWSEGDTTVIDLTYEEFIKKTAELNGISEEEAVQLFEGIRKNSQSDGIAPYADLVDHYQVVSKTFTYSKNREPLNKSPSFSAERENRRLPLGSSDSVGK